MNRQQFFRHKPATIIQYETLQIFHPDIGWKRYVTGQQTPQTFYVDGVPQEFKPYGFRAAEPEQGSEGEVVMDIQLGTVGPQVTDMIEQIDNWRAPVEVIWGQYLSSDLTAASYTLDMEADTITIEHRTAMINAAQVNQSAYDVSVTYKTDIFPGLSVSI